MYCQGKHYIPSILDGMWIDCKEHGRHSAVYYDNHVLDWIIHSLEIIPKYSQFA